MRFATLYLILAAVLSACNGSSSPGDADSGEFGDAFEIVTGPHPSMPDDPPIVRNDSLIVMVQYGGGCRNHDFDLAHRVRRDTADVWLTHNANEDPCRAMITDRLSFSLPSRVSSATVIRLIGPDGGPPLPIARVSGQ